MSGSPPRSSIEDLICDLAQPWAGDRLAGLVADVVRDRRTTSQRMERTIDRRGRFPGAAGLRSLVADVGAGAESALELRYLRDVERAHRLPRGARQVRDRLAGRSIARDVLYERFGLVVELDGTMGHVGLEDRFTDLGRDAAAAQTGLITLRYVWREVAGRPCAVARQVAGVLAARGWTGQPRRCGPSCGV
jgi:very-short-patch-repair endonuclease